MDISWTWCAIHHLGIQPILTIIEHVTRTYLGRILSGPDILQHSRWNVFRGSFYNSEDIEKHRKEYCKTRQCLTMPSRRQGI